LAAILVVATGARLDAEPVGLPVGTIVSAGSPAPVALLVSTGGGDAVDLVAGRVKLPDIGSLRLSIWVTGGPLLTPLVREQVFEGKLVTDAEGIARCRFRLPAYQAKPGAMLRLAVSEVDNRRTVAEAWLLVVAPFDPLPLRRWVERHPVAIDPAFAEMAAAFKQWGVPEQEMGNAVLAIVGADSKIATGEAAVLTLRQAKDNRVRVTVYQSHDNMKLIDASVPALSAISTDLAVQREFLLVMREAAKLLGDDPSSLDL
jgi:hypothetical protein